MTEANQVLPLGAQDGHGTLPEDSEPEGDISACPWDLVWEGWFYRQGELPEELPVK